VSARGPTQRAGEREQDGDESVHTAG
jgi:hypothetical protein